MNHVLRGLAAKAALPPGLADRLIAVAVADAHIARNPPVARTSAVRPAASPTGVEDLARSRNPDVRTLLARRRDLPAGIRDALAADPDAKVVKSVAAHPGLSEARLRAMADRHGARVVAVAADPDATAALLEDLARHEPPVRRVFRTIARHPAATAPSPLACLADDTARPVAAGRPALPPPVIAELLTDTDTQAAEAAAGNPSLPLTAMSGPVPRR